MPVPTLSLLWSFHFSKRARRLYLAVFGLSIVTVGREVLARWTACTLTHFLDPTAKQKLAD